MRKQSFVYISFLFAVLVLPFICACGGDDDDEGGKGGKTSTEYVDLGLSVKWATCNLGAKNPWEYGDYYAWGDAELKSVLSHKNYVYRDKHPNVLPLADDPASVRLGSQWHTPTKGEFQELIDNCKRVVTTLNGTLGWRLVGPNGNSIFLPAAGLKNPYRLDENGQNQLLDQNSWGYYWSSSLGKYDEMISLGDNPNEIMNFPYFLEFNGSSDQDDSDVEMNYDTDYDGSVGFSIRPVHP